MLSSTWREDDLVWDGENFSMSLKDDIYGDMTIICSEQLEDGKKEPLFKYWVHTAFLLKNKECEDFISVNDT